MAFRAAFLSVLLAAIFLLGPGDVEGTKVTFELIRQVDFGQGFVIAGSVTQLGNWDPAKGARMSVTGSQNWTVTVDIPEGLRVEYKPVRIVYNDGSVLAWRPGSNLVLNVPSSALVNTIPSEPLFVRGPFSRLSSYIEQVMDK